MPPVVVWGSFWGSCRPARVATERSFCRDIQQGQCHMCSSIQLMNEAGGQGRLANPGGTHFPPRSDAVRADVGSGNLGLPTLAVLDRRRLHFERRFVTREAR
jgi:hypothetical protein